MQESSVLPARILSCNIVSPGKSSKTAVKENYTTAQIFEHTLKPSTVMMTVWSTMREAEANCSGHS
jgi:hypothetical protein